MTSHNDSRATGVSRRSVLRNTAVGITAFGLIARPVAADDCVSINEADKEELQTLRHVNEDRAEQIIAARPFRNVNHLVGLSFWFDPRQPAEMVDSDPGVCEYDVAAVDRDVDGPPFPNIDGVAYSQGRVGERHGGDDYAHDVGDRVTFAGFERGGTTVADFRVFTTEEQNWNVNWDLWRQQPHKTITLPIQLPGEQT